jgi:hypothetical protein
VSICHCHHRCFVRLLLILHSLRLIHNYALDDMVTSLCTSGILNMSVDDEGYTPRPLVGLNVSLFDMITAFKDTPHSRLANKHLTEVLDF